MPHRSLRPALLTLALAFSCAAIAGAQTLTADQKAMAAYKLTMVNVKKVAAVDNGRVRTKRVNVSAAQPLEIGACDLHKIRPDFAV